MGMMPGVGPADPGAAAPTAAGVGSAAVAVTPGADAGGVPPAAAG
jgi:hypothetical protein